MPVRDSRPHVQAVPAPKPVPGTCQAPGVEMKYAAVGAAFGTAMALVSILAEHRAVAPSAVGWALGGILLALLLHETDRRRRRRRRR